MEFGIIVQTNDGEKIWNGFRLASKMLENGHEVRTFLLGDGVEAPDIEPEGVNPHGMMLKYVQNGGELLACGSCLDSRELEEDELRPRSSMQDLAEIIEGSDETITVG